MPCVRAREYACQLILNDLWPSAMFKNINMTIDIVLYSSYLLIKKIQLNQSTLIIWCWSACQFNIIRSNIVRLLLQLKNINYVHSNKYIHQKNFKSRCKTIGIVYCRTEFRTTIYQYFIKYSYLIKIDVWFWQLIQIKCLVFVSEYRAPSYINEHMVRSRLQHIFWSLLRVPVLD